MRKIMVVFSLLCAFCAPICSAQNSIPLMVNYQGVVRESGVLVTGEGYFRFAIIDAGTPQSILWSNDGSFVGQNAASIPTNSVILQVKDGLYRVNLGDATIPNMVSIPVSVLRDNAVTYLRVWFNTAGKSAELLQPDVRLVSVPYAYKAGSLDGKDIIDNSIPMGKLARESVGPQHEGRNNTIVSVYFDFSANNGYQLIYTVPLSETFVLTDIFITSAEIGPLWKMGERLGATGTPTEKIIVDARAAGLTNFTLSLKAGVPFSSSDTLNSQLHLGQFTTGDLRHITGTICGFKFANVP
jgi:hypothetical protein